MPFLQWESSVKVNTGFKNIKLFNSWVLENGFYIPYIFVLKEYKTDNYEVFSYSDGGLVAF